jgi:hypothetical protein
MLRDGDFALEITVYETNTPPHFRLYAYRNDKPIPPSEVQASMQLKRRRRGQYLQLQAGERLPRRQWGGH